FNLGESETIQLKDLIVAIENALGKKAKINRLPEQPGDMPLTCADISKARKLLGYNPTTRLNEGLPKFIDWFLQIQRAAGTEGSALPTKGGGPGKGGWGVLSKRFSFFCPSWHASSHYHFAIDIVISDCDFEIAI